MSGLGKVQETKGMFLTLAGGFIWDRKADESHPEYAEQEYQKADKSTGVRSGAQYADLTGMVTDVIFRTHEEFGENVNVNIQAGEDTYTLSIGFESRYCVDMLKALLVADLTKPLFIKPYDFITRDKKRMIGLSFRQDGEKLNLRFEDQPLKDGEWFKSASKREIKRFFDDVLDYFVGRVKAEVCAKFESTRTEKKPEDKAPSKKADAKAGAKEKVKKTELADKGASEEVEKVTPLKMKRFLKEYISENYYGKELPNIKGDELVEWYNLAKKLEELPFEEDGDDANEEPDDNFEADMNDEDLDAELNKLL